MCTRGLWKSLRGRLCRAPIPLLRRQMSVQHLGLPDAELDVLQQVFDKIGKRLGLGFELKRHSGDIVLLDVPFATRVSSQLVQALAEGRPVVLIAGLHGDDEWLLGPDARFARREQVLLRQLCDLPLVRQRAHGWLGDRWSHGEPDVQVTLPGDDSLPGSSLMHSLETGHDSRLEPGALCSAPPEASSHALLLAVLAGRHDMQRPALAASYGPGAHMRFHFHTRLVQLDPAAQRLLRVHREMPRLVRDLAAAPPASDAIVRELDHTLWDLGMACGDQPLLHEPPDWWRSPVQSRLAAPDAWGLRVSISSYSRAPRHLELARCLAEGPTTPAVLSRRARIGTSDLRAFLQACLVLDLVAWCPPQAVDA